MIEAARPADVAAVAALEAVCLGPDAWSEALVEQGVVGSLPTIHYLVDRDGDTVVAYAVVSVAGDVAELQRVAVDQGHRRRGIATRLLDEVLRKSAADGAERLLLEVREGNAAAIALYAARGFEEIARRPRYYRDGAAALVLSLPVTRPDVNVLTTS